ncbi:MAG TPA: ROK family protein [Rhodothermales bacterium]
MTVLGIDVGGSGIKGAPVDIETGKLVEERHRIATPQPATLDAVASVIGEISRHFDWHGPIGVAFPARIKKGVALTAANIDKAWINTDAAALFRKHTGCPCQVLNDADAAGVAEMHFGAGKGRNDLVLVATFGTGIGTALFIRQTLIPNAELGHILLPGRGPAEPYAADRARKEDDLTWEEWAGRVQEYLDRIEFLLAPDLIILGGGISKPKKTAKFLHLLHPVAQIVPAKLENEAGIVGAAFSAYEAFQS